jgi:hypothetical protein
MSTADRRMIMRHRHSANIMRAGLLATLLLTAGSLVVAAHAARTTPAFTASQATTCIQTAMAAQSGMVTRVEVEEKRGQRLCSALSHAPELAQWL